MKLVDISGNLYSSKGLKFGGFQTSNFIEVTEKLEEIKPGIIEEIIAEAHYLIFWLYRFPEIAFFLGIVFFKSILVALLLFSLAFILEIIRFYIFGTSVIIAHICRIWDWIKIPLFVITSVFLWTESSFLSIILF